MNDPADPRFADIILPYSEQNAEDADVIIIGVPTDEGIRRNGGRTGAAQAPKEIRKQLSKLTPATSSGIIENILICDYPDITGITLEEIHEKAKSTTADFIRAGKIVIALGGGHDITYPLASGFYEGIDHKDFALINIDAHLDVRQKKDGLHHSGSSFRLLIEENILKGKYFTEFGIQPFSFARNHLDWVKDNGGKIIFFDDLYQKHISKEFESYLASDIPHYISFDIDSVKSSDAPGCSAPSPIGFRAEDAIHICYHAGLHPTTVMLDIAEVNPLFDLDNRTTQLAGRMIASFLSGISDR